MQNMAFGTNSNKSRRGILSVLTPPSWADPSRLAIFANACSGSSGTAARAAGVTTSVSPPTPSSSEIYSLYIKQVQPDQPLFWPEPDTALLSHYRKTGVRIGDVGLITQDVAFDPLFNVWDKYKHTNPSTLPGNFETIKDVEIAEMEYFPPDTHLFSHGVHQKKLSDTLFSYRCSEEAGAILELPEGATLFEAKDVRAFNELANLHAKSWNKYARTNRPNSASTGTLCLVTGCIKTEAWGIAVFDKPSTSEDYLQFAVDEKVTDKASPSRYEWMRSGSVSCKIRASEPNSGDKENQCIFLRGRVTRIDGK